MKQIKYAVKYPTINKNGDIDLENVNTKLFRDSSQVMEFLNIKSINIFSKIVQGQYKCNTKKTAYLKNITIEKIPIETYEIIKSGELYNINVANIKKLMC